MNDLVDGNGATIKECLKHSNTCNEYINTLLKAIQKEFLLGRIDRYAYEYQINLLTVVKLQIEHIQTVTKETINKNLGVFIDVSV